MPAPGAYASSTTKLELNSLIQRLQKNDSEHEGAIFFNSPFISNLTVLVAEAA